MTPPDTAPADASLIAATLAGQTTAFATLVERYQAPLLRLATSRLGRHDWAEDAVQETFLWAYKSLATYDSRYSFRTWLWTILLNQCNRSYQRHARRTRREAEAIGEASAFQQRQLAGDVSPTDALLAKERAEQLTAVLDELPDVQADALRLRFFGELKFQEIADVQGCSLTSAKNRVRWGLLKMAERLGASALALAPRSED